MRTTSMLIALGTVVLGGGCAVDPFCLDCADGGFRDAGSDGAVRDAAPDADAGAVTLDAGTDACVAGGGESCNRRDDDCDGLVDEDFDLSSDLEHCGLCNTPCAPAHAFGACTEGSCSFTSCDVGWLDVDGDAANGCEYHCLPTGADDALCDLRDNDCDGVVDEDVALNEDPLHCGSCGRLCRFAHGAGACDASACVLAECDPGFYDIDAIGANGCEYACAVGDPPHERCNRRDDDCDGIVDDGDPDGGATCGTDEGACSTGIERCVDGALICTGSVTPVTELCNAADDDCDGLVDEGDPQSGSLCGTSVGVCEHGHELCVAGALVCQGGVSPAGEVCNGLDDDCDGNIDEGDPGGGAACGDAAGACAEGLWVCRGGVIVCEGSIGPANETCNAVDDDCDGSVDEGDPGGGGPCGSDVGSCATGARHCVGGVLECLGAIEPSAESCNSLDDDCDNRIDESNPGGGGACASDVGECASGTFQCAGGALQCLGALGPVLEACNSRDDDCDGAVDEDFQLASDARHCGACGNACSAGNAISACAAGSCVFTCTTGFHDLDGVAGNGCEYACDVAGTEICNGRDDDCDGSTDEGLASPANFCNPNGVCGATGPVCSGASGWTCTYPGTHEDSEATCDGLDNDCDGVSDDPFGLLGTSCHNGELGTCFRSGAFVCNTAGDGVACSAPVVGAGAAETCNGRDDDCDGGVDEGAPTSWVRIDGTFGTRWIFAYEASRPDASASQQGAMTGRACSEPGRLPWTNVTYGQAEAACIGAGGRLCTEDEWEQACQAASSCTWSYATACSSYDGQRCNGNDYDFNPATAADEDGTLPTGTLLGCRADWGGGRVIHDMSGNVEEWARSRGPGVNPLRGGSNNDTAGGIACEFDFAVAGNAFQLPSVGFRCCRDTAP